MLAVSGAKDSLSSSSSQSTTVGYDDRDVTGVPLTKPEDFLNMRRLGRRDSSSSSCCAPCSGGNSSSRSSSSNSTSSASASIGTSTSTSSCSRSKAIEEEREKAEREAFLQTVRKDGLQLIWGGLKYRSDFEVVRAAVNQNGQALLCAAPELQANETILREALKGRSDILASAPLEARCKKSVLADVLAHDGLALRWADMSLQKDREIVLQAVEQNGLALKFAHRSLQNDAVIVRAAVRQNGMALAHAARRFWSERDMVLEAVRTSAGPFKASLGDDLGAATAPLWQAGGELLPGPTSGAWWPEVQMPEARSEHFVEQEGKWEKRPFSKVVNSVTACDNDFFCGLERLDGAALQFAHSDLRGDREIVFEAVRRSGLALRWGDYEARGDKDIVMAAVEHNGLALQFAAKRLRCDFDIVRAAVRQNGLAIAFAWGPVTQDREIAFDVVRSKGQRGWSLLPRSLQRLPQLAPQAVKDNPFALPGTSTMVCSLFDLTIVEDFIDYSATLGLAGRTVKGSLPREASVADLGRRLRMEQSVGHHIHLMLPEATETIHPLDSPQTLAELCCF